MKWNKDKSALLSMVCIGIFAVILLLVDIFAFRLTSHYYSFSLLNVERRTVKLLLSIYGLSIPAWICLYRLFRLLRNIMDEKVFTAENVSHLRAVSWCCASAALISLLSGLYYMPFLVIAIAAAFMMLIVRIVKNVFTQAVDMKSELDLTI